MAARERHVALPPVPRAVERPPAARAHGAHHPSLRLPRLSNQRQRAARCWKGLAGESRQRGSGAAGRPDTDDRPLRTSSLVGSERLGKTAAESGQRRRSGGTLWGQWRPGSETWRGGCLARSRPGGGSRRRGTGGVARPRARPGGEERREREREREREKERDGRDRMREKEGERD